MQNVSVYVITLENHKKADQNEFDSTRTGTGTILTNLSSLVLDILCCDLLYIIHPRLIQTKVHR